MKSIHFVLSLLLPGTQAITGMRLDTDANGHSLQYSSPNGQDYQQVRRGKAIRSDNSAPTILFDGIQGYQSSGQYYSLMCPHLHQKDREIHPGYKVRFFCGEYGNHTGKQLRAETPEDCAQLCQHEIGCAGSTWLADNGRGRCVLSGDLPSGFRKMTLYMKKVTEEMEDPDPFPDSCEEHLNQCHQKNSACEQQSVEQLSQCSRDKHTTLTQLVQCTEDNAHYLSQIEALKSQLDQSQKDAEGDFKQCNNDSGKVAIIDGQKYTVWCNRYYIAAYRMVLSRTVNPSATIAECLSHCNHIAGCTGVHYRSEHHDCVPVSNLADPSIMPASTHPDIHIAIRHT